LGFVLDGPIDLLFDEGRRDPEAVAPREPVDDPLPVHLVDDVPQPLVALPRVDEVLLGLVDLDGPRRGLLERGAHQPHHVVGRADRIAVGPRQRVAHPLAAVARDGAESQDRDHQELEDDQDHDRGGLRSAGQDLGFAHASGRASLP
jgi:hypothetical protein